MLESNTPLQVPFIASSVNNKFNAPASAYCLLCNSPAWQKNTGFWRQNMPKQRTDVKQAALFLLQNKRKSYFLPLQQHFPFAHVTKRKSNTCAYVDCDQGESKDEHVEIRAASWASAPVADTEHRWSPLNKAAAVSCSESHQCCQELQWAAKGLLVCARIYHSATREQQMRETFLRPAAR